MEKVASEKIVLENIANRLQILSALKTVEELERQLKELEEENEAIHRKSGKNEFKDIEESKEVKEYFKSLDNYIRGIRKVLFSKTLKFCWFTHNFSYFTVLELITIFFIGLVFSLILGSLTKISG